MKKILLVVLVTLMFSFSACGSTSTITEEIAFVPYPREGRQTKLVGDEALTGELMVSELAPDFSSADDMQFGDQITAAAEKFKELYPNVKLNIERGLYASLDEYIKIIGTQIMAGEGPDIFPIVVDSDTQKTMRSGNLADLRSYFENDKSFNIADYNEAVFSGAQPAGKQYVVVTGYTLPTFLSTNGALEIFDIDKEGFQTLDGAIKELDKLLKKADMGVPADNLWKRFMIPGCFLDLTVPNYINYDNGSVNVTGKNAERFSEIIRPSYFENPGVRYGDYTTYLSLWKSNKLALAELYEMDMITTAARLATQDGQSIEIMALPNENGGITALAAGGYAVNASCKNMEAAYNFLKVLISEEVQTTPYYEPYCVPISNKAAEFHFEKAKEPIDNMYFGGEMGMVDLPPVPEDFIDDYQALINRVDSVILNNGMSSGIYIDAMMPYYKGEKSYKEATADAKRALEIYVSE